jgi:hypothetical protein
MINIVPIKNIVISRLQVVDLRFITLLAALWIVDIINPRQERKEEQDVEEGREPEDGVPASTAMLSCLPVW